ncbi:DUF3575 domain-containing protein [uncultured Bacteroides sp.]|uniref:DUF3575 domain-containing protein n=1 Tax=uncultured Bacteroides sp. TaxID=162156 RepID=UPI002AAB1405|nr:DUF3575 domain-containing protein [uncultured Bacteroides sp.]
MTAISLHRNLGKLVLFSLLLLGSSAAMAQRIALKTNALYWATLSPNIDGEFRLSRHVTLDLGVAGNFSTTVKDNTFKFQQVSPEVRYWFSRPMARHFVGLTGFAANYNFKFNDTKYDGDALAAGLTYGFDWVLSRRCNLETTVGAGMLKYRCFDYPVDGVKPLSPNKDKTIFAPLKLGVSFSYLLF